MLKFLGFLFAVFAFVLPLSYVYHFEPGLKSRQPAQAPFHSATVEEMANPRCLNQDHVHRNDLKSFLKKYSDVSKLELPAVYEVSGIRFENEHPELVYRFMQLVTPDKEKYYANSNLDSSVIRKAFGAPRGCNKVLCAVQRIFGQEEGPLMLLLLAEYDLNLSQYVWINADSWKASEIRDLMKAIEAVPSHLLPLDLNQKVIRFKRGYSRATDTNGTVMANATIEVFDVWAKEPHPIRQYAMYHEFSHNWSDLHANDIDVSPEWLAISGWESQKQKDASANWRMHIPVEQVSIYAKTNPFEDFAESVSAYRYAPQRLKKVSAAKYKFVKDVVYGGMEFNGTCPKSNNVATLYEQDFKEFDTKANSKYIQNVAIQCLKANMAILKNPTLKSGFLSCVSIAAATDVLRSKGQNPGSNKPLALYDALGGARIRFHAIERVSVANLKNSVVAILQPHLKYLQDAVDLKNCRYSFDSRLTQEQAKFFGVKDFEMYFGVQNLNERICGDLVKSGVKKVSVDAVKAQLQKYF